MPLYHILSRCAYVQGGVATVHRYPDAEVELSEDVASGLGSAVELIVRRPRQDVADEASEAATEEQPAEDVHVQTEPAEAPKKPRSKSRRSETRALSANEVRELEDLTPGGDDGDSSEGEPTPA